MRRILSLICLIGLDFHTGAQAVFKTGGHTIKLEEGDLIFRSGVGKESEFVRDFSFFDKTFTHVGIVLKENGIFWVYHMLGGIGNTGRNLRKDSVSVFVRYPDNECFGVYHTSLAKLQIARFKTYISGIQKKGVVFDLHFRLHNGDSLYCTEMVTEGLKYASQGAFILPPRKIDISGTKYRNAFGGNQGVILFYPVDALQHSSFLKKKAIVFYPNYKPKS